MREQQIHRKLSWWAANGGIGDAVSCRRQLADGKSSSLPQQQGEHLRLRRHADLSAAAQRCPVWSRVYFVVNFSTLSPSRNFMALQWILPQFSGRPRGPISSWMYCSHRSVEIKKNTNKSGKKKKSGLFS